MYWVDATTGALCTSDQLLCLGSALVELREVAILGTGVKGVKGRCRAAYMAHIAHADRSSQLFA